MSDYVRVGIRIGIGVGVRVDVGIRVRREQTLSDIEVSFIVVCEKVLKCNRNKENQET